MHDRLVSRRILMLCINVFLLSVYNVGFDCGYNSTVDHRTVFGA